MCVHPSILCVHTEANGCNLSQRLGVCLMEWLHKQGERRWRAGASPIHKHVQRRNGRHEQINWGNDGKGAQRELSIMNIHYWVGALGGNRTGERKNREGEEKCERLNSFSHLAYKIQPNLKILNSHKTSRKDTNALLWHTPTCCPDAAKHTLTSQTWMLPRWNQPSFCSFD